MEATSNLASVGNEWFIVLDKVRTWVMTKVEPVAGGHIAECFPLRTLLCIFVYIIRNILILLLDFATCMQAHFRCGLHEKMRLVTPAYGT